VIKFVRDLQQVDGFLRVLQFPPPIKLATTNMTEILLKVALNTIIHPIHPFILTMHSKLHRQREDAINYIQYLQHMIRWM